MYVDTVRESTLGHSGGPGCPVGLSDLPAARLSAKGRAGSDTLPGGVRSEFGSRRAAGDQAAWRAIYDDTCQPLFNFLCYQTGDREVAKDLLQETYVTALGRLGTYRGEGSVTGWLRR